MSAGEVLADLVMRGEQAWSSAAEVDAPVHRVVSLGVGPTARLACGGERTTGVVDGVGRFARHLFWCAGCWASGPS